MKELLGLISKVFNNLIDGGSEKQKQRKDTKACVIKVKIKFEDYKNYLEAAQLENKIKYLKKN